MSDKIYMVHEYTSNPYDYNAVRVFNNFGCARHAFLEKIASTILFMEEDVRAAVDDTTTEDQPIICNPCMFYLYGGDVCHFIKFECKELNEYGQYVTDINGDVPVAMSHTDCDDCIESAISSIDKMAQSRNLSMSMCNNKKESITNLIKKVFEVGTCIHVREKYT